MQTLLTRIALQAIEMINDNIEQKQDYKGNAFAPYSFSYWLKSKSKLGSTKGAKAPKDKRKRKVFLDTMRARFNQAKNNVTLTDTGEMLSALSVLDTKTDSVKIGFNTKRSAELAFYHNVSGSGKKKVKREFFALSDKQIQKLKNNAQDAFKTEIVAMLKKSLIVE